MDNKNIQITNHDIYIGIRTMMCKLSVMLINNDIWLTQNQLAEIYKTIC